MKRVDNKKNLYKSIILLVLLVIGIGYAYLTSNLSITGATEVVANTWDIHFENLNVTTGSVTATTPAEIDSNETSINYAITLSRPKDFYEFTVDVVNEGTLPGKVSVSELSGLDTTSSKVIDYEVKYIYNQPVNVGDILNGGDTKTIKVRVFYKDDITEDDFLDNNLNLNLTYTLQFLQSDKDEVSTGTLLQNLKGTNSCITKYSGNVTDKVGITEEATNVYFDKCLDKRNIIFGGFCWQVIRTTETGGLKMIYNGEPVDGKCESDREDHLGIVGTNASSINMNSEYLYGESYSYDTANNTFTLNNTFTKTWSDLDYESLFGKYTCKIDTDTDTCNRIYEINGYESNTKAITTSYTIADTNYAQIGTAPFNANRKSPAMVGYMFNKVYNYLRKAPGSTKYKYSNSFIYDDNTNNYVLSGTTNIIGEGEELADWASGYNQINNTHYTCWNEEGNCTTISYVYATNSTYAYYIELSGGIDIDEAFNEMLFDNNVNMNNSSVKGLIDNWFNYNMVNKILKLENSVFCNSRSIRNLGGWESIDGDNAEILHFKGSNSSSLDCPNVTDQFSVENNKARLTYPIAMLTSEEYKLASLKNTNSYYWTLSPNFYNNEYANVWSINTEGVLRDGHVYSSHGARPVISLASFNTISKGTGSTTDPWVIDD